MTWISIFCCAKDETFLWKCPILGPCAHILTPPYDPLYMRNSLLRTSQLCNPSTKTLQYGLQYNPSLSQVLSPLGHPLKPFLGTPLGMSCKKVRRYCALFDLYLTYSTVIAKTPWAYLANISHFFIGLKLFWLTKNQFKSIKRGVKFSKDFWLNFGRYRRLLQIHSLIS